MSTLHNVRVRFAPAPTGYLHIGSLKMALFNWVFARHHGGAYLVRVEDTDHERCRPEYTEAILRTLDWVDLRADEPLVYQSQRYPIYAQETEKLLASGAAYRCYCTQHDMQQRVRRIAADGHEYFVYDGFCRTRKDAPDAPCVIRLAVPRDRDSVVVQDLCRGTLEFPTSAIDDFVLVRSDGSPMYNYTVVVDDALMRISHVIRGDDHIVNTPRQLLIYEALGFSVPQFAHLPLILGKDGMKLSKRDAAVSVDAYREMGFLAEALCNYLMRLGWADGDQEFITREELVKRFSLEDVGRKGAQFDYTKLLWMNGEYIKSADAADLLARTIRDVDTKFLEKVATLSAQQLLMGIRLYQQRSKTLLELRDHLCALAHGGRGVCPDVGLVQAEALRIFLARCAGAGELSETFVAQLLKDIAAQCAISFADLAMPLRWALVGATSSPPIGALMMLLGLDECRMRILRLIEPRS